jgi:hypothetical protein
MVAHGEPQLTMYEMFHRLVSDVIKVEHHEVAFPTIPHTDAS